MKKLLLLFAALLLSAGVCAQSWLTPDVTKDLMPVSQVKTGMKGYGLTVFQGTRIEKFNFEVRGVLKEANSGGDLILVHLRHPLIDKRMSGVIQG
ncbi:MAG: SpoIVB peptidase S55, partial [Abditibacteriota bacterium]|nr:SpoIVB peptidase S55 [Abditibacteriota bacterium]